MWNVASGLEPVSFWSNFITVPQNKSINNKYRFLYRILFLVSAVDSIIFLSLLLIRSFSCLCCWFDHFLVSAVDSIIFLSLLLIRSFSCLGCWFDHFPVSSVDSIIFLSRLLIRSFSCLGCWFDHFLVSAVDSIIFLSRLLIRSFYCLCCWFDHFLVSAVNSIIFLSRLLIRSFSCLCCWFDHFLVSAVDSIIFSPALRSTNGRLLWRSHRSVLMSVCDLMSSCERIFMKFGVGGLYKTLWNKHEFHENRTRDSWTLFQGVNEFLPHTSHMS
jgi:hypothetical protein